jgi:hypothetical protein
LAAIEQSGTLQPLDGLHPPLSDAPNPQGYAMRAQLPVLGVKVEGFELLDPPASCYFSSDQPGNARQRGRARGQLHFQLEFV